MSETASKVDDGGPAFPQGVIERDYMKDADGTRELRVTDLTHATEGGISIRDYFAAKAMAVFSSHRDVQVYGIGTPKSDMYCEECAIASYRIADAMLKARSN